MTDDSNVASPILSRITPATVILLISGLFYCHHTGTQVSPSLLKLGPFTILLLLLLYATGILEDEAGVRDKHDEGWKLEC